MKLRLKDGAREIELEGDREDIDALLERWWHGSARAEEEPNAGGPEPSAKPKAKRRAKPKAASSTVAAEAAEPELNPVDIANRIRESEHFPIIERKIIHAARESDRKSSFVLWFAKQPLTSGQIHKWLDALHIRVPLPRISEAMKANQFLPSGKRGRGQSTKYRLSAPAQKEFEEWLFSDGK